METLVVRNIKMYAEKQWLDAVTYETGFEHYFNSQYLFKAIEIVESLCAFSSKPTTTDSFCTSLCKS